MKKISLGGFVCIFAAQLCPADLLTSFTDDFNRADTDWIAGGGAQDLLGENYTVTRGKFRISKNSLLADSENPQEKEIRLDILPTVLGDGRTYEASVDFMVTDPDDGLAVGIAFNYSASPNEIKSNLLRFRGGGNNMLQFFGSEDGKDFTTIARDVFLESNRWYQISIRCEKFPALEYKLKEPEKNGNELASGIIDLSNVPLTEGFLALHVNGSTVRLDNFAVTIK